MKRLLLACAAVAALLFALPSYAQTTVPRYVFVAVDALETKANVFTVTGVIDGESEARAITFTFSTSSSTTSRDDVAACQRLALLAMTRPGQFRFEVAGGTTSYQYPACKLSRVTP
jgi:hypothetical protein